MRMFVSSMQYCVQIKGSIPNNCPLVYFQCNQISLDVPIAPLGFMYTYMCPQMCSISFLNTSYRADMLDGCGVADLQLKPNDYRYLL